MIINIKHKSDLITIDLNLKELRIIKNRNEIFKTIKLSNNDIIGYEYAFKNNYIKTLLGCVVIDLKNSNTRKENYLVKLKDLEVLK
jgi:hypothetical protein